MRLGTDNVKVLDTFQHFFVFVFVFEEARLYVTVLCVGFRVSSSYPFHNF